MPKVDSPVNDYSERQIQTEKDIKDLAVLNKKAARLNREAEDVLSYQIAIVVARTHPENKRRIVIY